MSDLDAWAIQWKGRLYWGTDLNHGHFRLFRTRREARDAIEEQWAFLRDRPDLRAAPHHWRMPVAVRVSVNRDAR